MESQLVVSCRDALEVEDGGGGAVGCGRKGMGEELGARWRYDLEGGAGEGCGQAADDFGLSAGHGVGADGDDGAETRMEGEGVGGAGAERRGVALKHVALGGGGGGDYEVGASAEDTAVGAVPCELGVGLAAAACEGGGGTEDGDEGLVDDDAEIIEFKGEAMIGDVVAQASLSVGSNDTVVESRGRVSIVDANHEGQPPGVVDIDLAVGNGRIGDSPGKSALDGSAGGDGAEGMVAGNNAGGYAVADAWAGEASVVAVEAGFGDATAEGEGGGSRGDGGAVADADVDVVGLTHGRLRDGVAILVGEPDVGRGGICA